MCMLEEEWFPFWGSEFKSQSTQILGFFGDMLKTLKIDEHSVYFYLAY